MYKNLRCAKDNTLPKIKVLRIIVIPLLIISILTNIFFGVMLYMTLEKNSLNFFNKKLKVIEQIYNKEGYQTSNVKEFSEITNK